MSSVFSFRFCDLTTVDQQRIKVLLCNLSLSQKRVFSGRTRGNKDCTSDARNVKDVRLVYAAAALE